MKALLAQLTPIIGDTKGNAQRAATAVRDVPEVDFAIFPELFISGYTCEGLAALALSLDSLEIRMVQETARDTDTVIVIGFAEKLSTGIGNSVACIDRNGEIAAVYRKVQLYGREREVFVPGDELLVLGIGGRRIAPLICFDIEFPELARQVAVAGADLLVTASANMAPYYCEHDVATLARAVENRVGHLYTNMVGPGSGLVFIGGSRAISPNGDILAAAPAGEETLLVTPVPEPGGVDASVDYLDFVQPPPPVRVAAAVLR